MKSKYLEIAYDLYYDMEKEYNRAVALEAVGSYLYWLAYRGAVSEKKAQAVWDDLNGEHIGLFVHLTVRYPSLKED